MRRKLNGQFSKRKHYKLPDVVKPILLYYYAGVGVVAVMYVIGLSVPVILDEIKINIKNEKVYYSKVGDLGRGIDDRNSSVGGENEPVCSEVSPVDENGGDRGAQEGDKSEVSLIDKIKAVFPEEPDIAVAIAKAESGLKPDTKSYTDYTSDGKPFSVGLFQINLSVHNLDDMACHTAFEGRNYKAKVVNEQLYNDCVALASDVDVNLRKARQIYESRGWNAWGVFTNKSFLEKL
jgi:hypothetical protein